MAWEILIPAEEIGDNDEDGMKEILDGRGRPIEILRWAPAFVTQRGPDNQWGVANVDDDINGTTDDLTEAGAMPSSAATASRSATAS